MVGETIDSKVENSETKDPVIAANIRELDDHIKEPQKQAKYTTGIVSEINYRQEHAYLNKETGRFTYANPTIEKDKYLRITFNVYDDGQILQVFDSSGGMHEGDVNLCRKQTILKDSDVFSEEVKYKVLCAVMAYNLKMKKKASERKTARLLAVQKNSSPKAPPKEEKKSLTQRLFKLIRGE